MATTAPPKSFLDLPCEIRFNIYEHLFRSTEICIHDVWSRGPDTCDRHNLNTCISFMTVNKLICREAMRFFFEETPFVVDYCECWLYLDIEDAGCMWPHVRNLTIMKDFASNFAYQTQGLCRFLSTVQFAYRERRKIASKNKMNSLVCHAPIDESAVLSDDEALHMAFIELPGYVQCLEFAFRFYRKGKGFPMKTMQNDKDGKISVYCLQEDFQLFLELLDLCGYTLRNISWVSEIQKQDTEVKENLESVEEASAGEDSTEEDSDEE